MGSPRVPGGPSYNVPTKTQLAFGEPPVVNEAKLADSGATQTAINVVTRTVLGLTDVSDVSFAGVQVNLHKSGEFDFDANLVLGIVPVDLKAFASTLKSTLQDNLGKQLGADIAERYAKKIKLNIKVVDGNETARKDLEQFLSSSNTFKSVTVNIVKGDPLVKFGHGGLIYLASENESITRFFSTDQKTLTNTTVEGSKLTSRITALMANIFGKDAAYRLDVKSFSDRYGTPEEDLKVTSNRSIILINDMQIALEEDNGIDVKLITFTDQSFGSSKPIAPFDSPDSYKNNRCEVRIIGLSRSVNSDDKELASKKRDSVVIKKSSDEEFKWKKFQFLWSAGARFHFLTGYGTSTGYAPGGQFDVRFGWTPVEVNGHSVTVGLNFGVGATYPMRETGDYPIYACYPNTITASSATGCNREDDNKKYSLSYGLHLTPGLNITYASPLIKESVRFYLSLVQQYEWDRYSIKKNNNYEITHPDIAKSNSEITHDNFLMGGEVAITFPVSKIPTLSEMGIFIRAMGTVLSYTHEGPEAVRFPYSSEGLSVVGGMIIGSQNVFMNDK